MEQERRELSVPQEEERETGHVRWAVYRGYLRLQGCWVPVTLASLALMQATRNASDLWLSYWVSQVPPTTAAAAINASAPAATVLRAAAGRGWGVGASPRSDWLRTAGPAALPGAGWGARQSWQDALDPGVEFYLSVLVALAAANSLFTLARAFAFAQGGLVAARGMHRRLLLAVLALPVAFFDATPAGRALNRFSSDTATADDSLPFIANIFLAHAAGLAGVAAVLCFVQPYLAAAVLPLVLLYRRLQRYYRATSRELRRLDAVAKSPVY